MICEDIVFRLKEGFFLLICAMEYLFQANFYGLKEQKSILLNILYSTTGFLEQFAVWLTMHVKAFLYFCLSPRAKHGDEPNSSTIYSL